MTLTERSTLGTVVAVVSAALRRHRVPAVLTGGACASLYTDGRYMSADMDFILIGPATQAGLDAALGSIGFGRRGDRYVHARTRFYVEFPRGPIAIGGDYRVAPVERRTRFGRFLLLSPTDACRDRLAAFYHWNDRQSLEVAVAIARRHRLRMDGIRRWSVAERSADRFAEFLQELRRAGTRRARRGRALGARAGLRS
ncbi:MAG: hypothetical protein AUH29_16175 [Candidatus Rokubacteria bacterium 13_1_40CM_69_27]|nr:MAG: hypothetical protein AUH29_16175 [Candidatus Rokubacteria bacterium 13_1_40CM_69_27]